MRVFALALPIVLAIKAGAAEETIRGVLEKTVRPGACAQIADALSEIYYIDRTDRAAQLVAPFVGKNIKLVITGVVEKHEGDNAYYFALKTVKRLEPAGATAPAPEQAPPKKSDEKNGEKPSEIVPMPPDDK